MKNTCNYRNKILSETALSKSKNWEVCIKLCLFVSVHLKKKCERIKNVNVISIISYVFNTLFKVKECERVSTSANYLTAKVLLFDFFFPVLVMY